MIDIQQELGIIATERKGSDVKQAIYDALDKLSKGGGPGPSPTPIDPNEFLPGSAHVRYYYSIIDGRIGVSTANPAEVIPVPEDMLMQSWSQGASSSSYDTYQKVVAYPRYACTMLAIVMHRAPTNSTTATYSLGFYDSTGQTPDNTWSLLTNGKSQGCGGTNTSGVATNMAQYISIYKKEVLSGGEVTAYVKSLQTPNGGTASSYSNRLVVTLVAFYNVSSIARVDNLLLNTDSDTAQDVFTRATNKVRLYTATAYWGYSDQDNVWFCNSPTDGMPTGDLMLDFREINTDDYRLSIAIDADAGTGKPWIRSVNNGTEDNVATMSFDISIGT